MIFILFKLYILFPYTKPTHHRKLSAFLHFQKTKNKLFPLMGTKNVLTRFLDIAIFVGTFCPHNVQFTWTTHMHS